MTEKEATDMATQLLSTYKDRAFEILDAGFCEL